MNVLNADSDGKLTVISLFAGCGGSSLGYQMAGFKELLAVEWDNNAVATFKLNFPDVPVYHGDICKLSGKECMKLAGIKPYELDILDGSPPCQGFSTAGKRRFNDPRNSLFMEFARLLKDLQPKVFVMENVTGIVKGCMKQTYLQIMAILRDCGYKAKGEILNAMYFNVPQSRERVFIIGVREDSKIEPSHPRPEGRPITVREAWVNCPSGDIPKLSHGIQKIIARIPVYGDGGDVTGKTYFGTKRLSWDRPSRSIIKEMIGTRTALIHPDEDRSVTLPEAKRLSSFPDSFLFPNFQVGVIQIGNSVPPNLMKVIAGHIKDNILVKIDG